MRHRLATDPRAAVAFLVPGDPETRTGGFVYDRRIVAGLEAAGRPVALVRLADGFPAADDGAFDRFARSLDGLADGTVTVIDGLAFGVAPALARRHARRLVLVALVHHPLALETGLDAASQAALAACEREALAQATRVIATSPLTARLLAGDYAVPRDRLGVVPPGTDPAPPAGGSGSGSPMLLCVGTLTPRKGHRVLVEALAQIRHLPWRLACAGSLERDPATAAAVAAQVRDLGLNDRIALLGEADDARLHTLYDQADIFVLASHFEGFGMVFTEAIARGLPIVATAGGATGLTVPAEAGMLVPPGDSGALGDALAAVLQDAGLRDRLRAGAGAARLGLATWDTAAAAFARQLDIAAAAPSV
ncbi:MAG: glycosyltransferase family 4 protein [Rhodospirillaceae bacterium]|nr:glycosyltransferase family 4 protein [Rhodospirillaceae bacterium]